jgi:molybdopterin-guanine dinucleotide biosynthesis protein A
MTGKPLGVVLAGGLARRMGGGDKARLRIGGRTILERVLARLKPQCAALILNAGDPAQFADTGLRLTACPICGPARRHTRRPRLGGARRLMSLTL